MRKEKIRNWVIVYHDNSVLEFIGPKNRLIFLAPNVPEHEKLATLQLLPKYLKNKIKEEI
jgi:hypothetical protein